MTTLDREDEVSAKIGKPIAARILTHENSIIFFGLMALVVFFTVLSGPSAFLSAQNIANIALNASQPMILVSGIAILMVAGGLDLSVGGIIIFASVVAGKAMLMMVGPIAESSVAPAWLLASGIAVGFLVAIVSGMFWGTVNGLILTRMRISPLIATLATLSVTIGLAQIISSGVNVTSLPVALQTGFGGARLGGILPYPVIVAIVVTVVLWILLEKTRFGMRTFAVGGSEQAASRAGIDVDRHMLKLYVLVGALSGLVAFIDISRFGTASLAGHSQDALNAIAAAVIGGVSLFGGKGKMSGAVIGVLIPAVLANGLVIIRVVPFWQNVAIGVVLVLAVYADHARRKTTTK